MTDPAALRAELAAKVAARTDAQLIDALIVADHMRMHTSEAGRLTMAYMVDELTRRFPDAVNAALDAWELDLTNGISSAVVAAEAARTALAARRRSSERAEQVG